ncbi:MAG: UDP-N-acetylglucosamine 2-epimerase (non-hydrolyzing) [Sphingomicrobium sp.]
MSKAFGRPLAPRRGCVHSGLAELGGRLSQPEIAIVIGTRPEAIKLAPVIHALDRAAARPVVMLTGQHPGLVLTEHGLGAVRATPLRESGLPDPLEHVDRVAQALARAWRMHSPDLVLVQGDTSSALGGARAAAALGLPLGHVEAGLRTHDPAQPWPEEGFRVEIDALADLLFAPTAVSAANLRSEGCGGDIHVTGNTAIDALLAAGALAPRPRRRFARRAAPLKLVVTCHRRESWGAGFTRVAEALIALAADDTAQVDALLHPNPAVSEAIALLLGGIPGIRLLPALSHAAMLDAMRGADLLLSDSGGVQEEAPALGIPLLVLRDKTERPEAIACGNMRLVGTRTARIVAEVRRLANDRVALAAMARPALPYGDGHAAPRIAALSLDWLAGRGSLGFRVLSA